jgi:uncharacterized protein with HEPN domain
MRHMLDAARRAANFVKSHTCEQLSLDDMPTLGLIKSLEIVGEAAGQVSDSTRRRFPEIPGQAIVGVPNRMVHGYDDVNLDIVWETPTRDLPALVAALENALED